MKIWSKQAFSKINRRNQEILQENLFKEMKPTSSFRVGIVGGGPKGAYAIERLASFWHSHLPDEKLEIICFNNNEHFASGPNYLPEQPDYLLINYSLGNVNFWTEEPEQLVKDRVSLLDFINKYQEKGGLVAHPEDFCSRALTGIYLQFCLCQVISSLPDTISVKLVPGAITSLDIDGEVLSLSSGNREFHSFTEVILCTGHSYSFQDELSKKLKSDAADNSYLEHIYPVTRFRRIDFAGKDVLIQGMGLTFVDAVLGLTEGLGGRFESSENSMTYIPSGLEPATIYPFSRSGLPMLARKAGGSENLPLKYFTDSFVEKLLESGNKLDFNADIYPNIENEYRYQFAKKYLNQYDGLLQSADSSLEELEDLAHSVIPDFVPFDLEKFLLPTNTSKFDHNAILEYIKQSIAPDRFSTENQSTQEMSAVWRAIYPGFRKLYNFGGLSGKSQEQVDQIYFGRFQRVSYGPPIWNMRKIYALAEADIIRFDIGPAPKLDVDRKTQMFNIKSKDSLKPIKGEILINARIAKMADFNSQPPIYKHLHEKYRIGAYQNGNYSPGCFKLDKEGALLNLKGVTLNGTPTEGWTLDNESLSRTNNNFITPWAKKIITNYVNTSSQINPYCSSMD
ncbi:FAD/NAD(P)-binding protein [Lunatibacter salilacus]|uniref:FAD/NAD(P)-binding protein n=1 Tax=Lunatibacter salilacus TaxID=2483804 RepID=UPI00131CF455|nr:FAD/NAD(P)-binding protein [Lunatibacter salilacus]